MDNKVYTCCTHLSTGPGLKRYPPVNRAGGSRSTELGVEIAGHRRQICKLGKKGQAHVLFISFLVLICVISVLYLRTSAATFSWADRKLSKPTKPQINAKKPQIDRADQNQERDEQYVRLPPSMKPGRVKDEIR